MHPVVELGDVCTTVMGQAPPSEECNRDGVGTPFVKAGEFSADGPIIREWTTKPLKLAKQSDVLVCVVGATCGKINRGADCAIGRSVAAVRSDPTQLDPSFLFRFLETWSTRLRQRSQGAAQTVITREMISELPLPLPPLPEQRRIAAILDKADALRAKRREAIAKLDQLLQSVFLDMFGDPVTNPKGWPTGRIGDMLASVKYGTSAKAALDGPVPILRMNNLTSNGEMDLADLKYIDLEPAELNKCLVRPGDILFNRTNSKELVGKTAVYEGPEPMAFAGYLVRGRISGDHAPEYISAYLNSPWGKKKLRGMCKSIVGMANINAQEFSGIEIAIPPPEVQTQFAQTVRAVRQRKAALRGQMLDLDRLFAALQRDAFAGQLAVAA